MQTGPDPKENSKIMSCMEKERSTTKTISYNTMATGKRVSATDEDPSIGTTDHFITRASGLMGSVADTEPAFSKELKNMKEAGRTT